LNGISIPILAVFYFPTLSAGGEGRYGALHSAALLPGFIHTDLVRFLALHLLSHLLAVLLEGRVAHAVRDIGALLALLNAGGDVGHVGANLVRDLLASFPGDLASHMIQDLMAFLPRNILTGFLLDSVANLLIHGLQDGFRNFVAHLLWDVPADLFRHLFGHQVLHIVALGSRD